MKRSVLFFSTALIITSVVSAFAFISHKNDVSEKHLELVMRNIGHQLLLRGNDSTSRVLPVTKTDEQTYQISFQNKMKFIPDTLINIVYRELKRYHLPKNYMVSVKDCQQKTTVFAYEINTANGNLIPCKEREQPEGCYLVEIEFIQVGLMYKSWFLLLLLPLCYAGLYWKGTFRKKQQKDTGTVEAYIQVGIYRFYPEKSLLNFEKKNISLSEKETKLLKIFTANLNQAVERKKMMKEIWEDQGTIVISRNADVLVSKLRKKLDEDSSIRIVNVHGRGYKMILE